MTHIHRNGYTALWVVAPRVQTTPHTFKDRKALMALHGVGADTSIDFFCANGIVTNRHGHFQSLAQGSWTEYCIPMSSIDLWFSVRSRVLLSDRIERKK